MASSERIFELLETPTENEGGARRDGTHHQSGGTVGFKMSTSNDEDAEDWILKGVSFSVGAPKQPCRRYWFRKNYYRQSALWLLPHTEWRNLCGWCGDKKWNVNELRERISISATGCILILGQRARQR